MGNKILIVYDNEKFAKQIEYVFDLMFSILGVEYAISSLERYSGERADSDLLVSYTKDRIENDQKPQIHIFPSGFFGGNYLKKESLPDPPLKRWRDLPVIFGNNSVRKNGQLIETDIDIIASSFFMVSRYEEVVLQEKDALGRFPAASSLADKERFLSRPIVQDYIELLWEWLSHFCPALAKKDFWPDKKNFAFCLTHDIDFVVENRLKFFKKNDLFWAFDYILDLEGKHNFKSSFYFIANKKKSGYSLQDARILNLLRKMEGEGVEVGLHGTSCDYEALKSEKGKLDEVVSSKRYGIRQHGLLWKTPDTWAVQEELGLLYDTSLGFPEKEGFRCGLCAPYKPFDLFKNRVLDIWELPLIVMDCTLFRPDYRNLKPSQGWEVVKNYIKIIEKYHGLLVILWHNSSFDNKGHLGWGEVYKKALDHFSKFSTFNGTGRDIINWCENRNYGSSNIPQF